MNPEPPIDQTTIEQASVAPTPVTSVTPTSPVPLANSGQPAESSAGYKDVHRAGTTALVLGILVIIIGVVLDLIFSTAAFLNVILGIVYIFYGVKLRSSQISVAQIISAAKIVTLVVIINAVFALVEGNRFGLLPLLLLYFMTKAMRELFKGGLITSASVYSAKPTT